jgi:hypothetical protein
MMNWIGKERDLDPPDWYWDGIDEDEGDQDAADAEKEKDFGYE